MAVMSRPGGYQTVEFRNVGTMAHAKEPWPRVFLVARTLLAEGQLEFRPLTVRNFFWLVLRNWATSAVWNLRRLAWRVGFIDFDEQRLGEAEYAGDWRWRWWLPRVGWGPGQEKRT